MKNIRIIPLVLAFFVASIAFAADEIHWTITGQDSVTFDWRGTVLENSIGYGLSPGAYTQITAQSPNPVPNSSQGPFWEAKLTGLQENTRYYYSIGNGPERTFHTAPSRGSSDFTIYAQGNIGDTTNYFNMGVIQDLIANGQPAFVIGLGDLTLGSNNGKAAVDQHFNDVMTWSKEAAYMPVWGDLDWRRSTTDNFNNYKGRFDVPNSQTSPGSPLAGGEDWYWFDYGNTRFITLPEPWSGAWPAWNTKADALMTEAQADPDIKYIVTFAHQSAYSSGHYTGSATLRGMLDTLGDTHSKYVLNVNAHSVNYERSYPQHGVVHITAGTGGANFQQDGSCLWLTCLQPSWSAYRAMHQGALKLHFTGSGIEGSFICGPAGGGINDVICTKGSVVDNFTIGSPTIAPSVNNSVVAVVAKAATTCTQTTLNVSSATSDGGFSYRVTKSFGTPADNGTYPTQSTLRFFENGIEMGPAHASHANIRSIGQGSFSHWSFTNGSGESLRFSASNNADPRSNGKSYTYCTSITATTTSDTQAPTVPNGLAATTTSSSQINLSWSASTDNVGVTGYKIFRNGAQVGTATTTSYSNSGLTANTSYTYTVAAYDAAGNTSGNSTAVAATTFGATMTTGNLLGNPGFESGTTIWSASRNTIISSNQPTHGGAQVAWLNGKGSTNTDTLYQTVTIPATATSATLSFWLHIDTAETTTNKAYDTLSVQVQNSSGTVLNTLATYSNLDKNTGYVQKSFDLSPYKGQTIRIFLKGTEDYSLKTSFILDDFLLETNTSASTTSATTTSLLGNPGFESGATIWSASRNTIISSNQPAHGGSQVASLNGFGYVNTDTLYQTVTIPATATSAILSFWLHIETAETTTSKVYDTLSVQVQDSSGTVLNTLATYSNLDKNTGYVQKSFDLSPYKGQTIRIFLKGTEDYSLKTSFILDDFLLVTDGAPTPVASSCAPAPTASLVVNVKNTGATGNGVTDDTAAIQAAINQVAGSGGTVLIPDGTYMIEAVNTHVNLKSNMTLRMSSGAILKAKPTNSDSYSILLLSNVSGVNIIGGTVQGERQGHLVAGNADNGYGMGIRLTTTNNVIIEGVTVRDNWGDGIYVGNSSNNTTICSVTADNNRRQGLSITFANGVVVKNSTFKNTNGAIPGAGMDIESSPGQSVSNVQITGSTFTENKGGGVRSALEGGTIRASNVVIDGNTLSNNSIAGINMSQTSGMRISNNIVQSNVGEGIQIVDNSTSNTIDRNTVTGNNNNGILIAAGSNNNTISNNTVTGNRLGQIVNNGSDTTSTNNTNTETPSASDTTSTNNTNTETPSASDTTSPSVAISSPASGTTISGTASAIAATASDNVGVSGVQFKIDGIVIGSEDTTSPYSVTLNTTLYSNGSHALSAVARDAAGNSKTSTGVTVTISNGTTPPPTTLTCAPAPTSSLVVNVKNTGATGNGVTDDTAAIQTAINQVGGTGGTVFIPDGTYMIEAVNAHLKLKSNMTLRLSSGAILKAKPYSGGSSAILLLDHVSNVNVIGGALDGNRAEHSPAVCGSYGTSTYCGEYGMGIASYGGSNLYYEDIISKNNWGDGFYVGGAASETLPKNINLCKVTADFNRRQGMSVISVDGMIVKNSIFKNTDGTAPRAGIDLEPNAGNTVKNVQIRGSVFTGNRGAGLLLYGGSAGIVTAITVDGNTLSGNTHDYGIGVFNSKNSIFTNNVIQNNWQGVTLSSDASGFVVNNNIVSQNSSANIKNSGSGNTITNNNTTAAIMPMPSPF